MIIKDKVEANIPTKFGNFKIVAFETKDKLHHVALVKGEITDNTLVRVHSECLTGDVFKSQKCDCGDQLALAIEKINKEGQGVFLYLRQEGRGIGLFNKIKAYNLQEKGMDTVEANIKLGFREDLRDYTIGAAILKELGVKKIRLLTNNPKKIEGLENFGIIITERVPLIAETNMHNKKYLGTKTEKLGHLFENKGFIDPESE